MKFNWSILLLAILLASCNTDVSSIKIQSKSAVSGSFKTLTPQQTNIHFTNTVNENLNRNHSLFDYFYNGSGVAIGDINNDGLADIFFSGNDTPNRLYLNKGGMVFEDISDAALPKGNRWANGCNMVDINEDGYLDIYVAYAGPDDNIKNKIDAFLINDGNGKFTDKISEYGLATPMNTVHTSFFDYDNDGDLDLWVNTHSNYKGNLQSLYDEFKTMDAATKNMRTNRLFRNDGNTFTDVTKKAKVDQFDFGLGLATVDFNNDNLIDVYVANDYFVPDFYYLNNGDGTFQEVTKSHTDHLSFFSMGTDAADINNDGILDLAIVDMTPKDHVRNKVLMESMDVEQFRFFRDELKFQNQYMFNVLQMGVGEGKFSEVGKMMGLSQTEWSWASLFADFDQDGYKDYFVSNGYYRDTKNNDYKIETDAFLASGVTITEEIFQERLKNIPRQPIYNSLFINQNGQDFVDYTKQITDYQASYSNGAAYGDLDNDGDLDLVVNNLGSPAHILENQINNNNFLGIRLQSNDKPSSVFNAKVYVHTGDMIQRMDYQFSRGYQSSMDQRLLFGLANTETIDKVVVQWLDGTESTVNSPTINQYLTINKDLSTPTTVAKEQPLAYFKDVSAMIPGFSMSHVENDYDDFAKEVLLPQQYSTLGPAMAIGDFNKDARDDLFIGSCIGEYSSIIMAGDNRFDQVKLPGSEKFEDIGATLFDYDNDKDLDIYVSTGGGGDIKSTAQLNDRIYINDGKGNFTQSINVLPSMPSSSTSVAIFDIDQDGDEDIFVAGRNNPGKYPQKEISYLLENNAGKYSIITPTAFKDNLPGMITDVEVLDYNQDGKLDMMITSEWQPPLIAINTGSDSKFEIRQIDGLENKSGWWQSITSGDFDGDGDLDYILGNLGLNNKFQPSEKKPLGVMAADFDKSGTLDIVLTKEYKGNIVPVRGKECSSVQMPFIAEKFPTYLGFASADINEIYGEEKVNNALKYTATSFESVILWNTDGILTPNPLPFVAQWSPILDAAVLDINKDGISDLVLGGNIHDTEPETPTYDAGKGIILLGNKDQKLEAIYDIRKTGIYLNNNTKHIGAFQLSSAQTCIAVANNNGPIEMYLLQ